LNQAARGPAADDPEPDAAGFVLAGGRSSRMGADKALELLAGQPLVAHAVSVLLEAGLAASIAGARSPLAHFAPVVEDSQPGLGPLGGICAALASTSACRAVFLPVDLPLLPASLIAFLLHHARITGAVATLCSVNGFAQTFPAVVRRAALPALQGELEAGRGGCFSAFQAAAARLGQPLTVLAAESLVQSGQVAHPDGLPAARWFLNVNAPGDLLRAGFHHRGSGRVS
jgi:molybdopterin-guanine dinucleotide biosynthesis protein A